MITQSDAREQVKRLVNAGYGLAKEATVDGVAALWAETLEVRPDELGQAVTAYVKGGGRYFPRPGDLLELVRQARGSRGIDRDDLQTRWNRWSETTGEPCPVCGAKLIVLEAHWGVPQGDIGRYGTLHDPERHNTARIPHAGYPQDAEYVKQVNAARARGAEERAQRRDRHLPASVVEPVQEAAD